VPPAYVEPVLVGALRVWSSFGPRHSSRACTMSSFIRECHGFCDPRGFVSRVDAGAGAGFDFQTCDIQNKPKNMKFGPEIAEI